MAVKLAAAQAATNVGQLDVAARMLDLAEAEDDTRLVAARRKLEFVAKNGPATSPGRCRGRRCPSASPARPRTRR